MGLILTIGLVSAAGFRVSQDDRVPIVSTVESPFVIGDSKLDLFRIPITFGSKEGGRSGFVIVRQSGDDESDLAEAATLLKSASISVVAKRISGEKIIFWGANGVPITKQEASVQKVDKTLLEQGGIAVKLTYPYYPKGHSRYFLMPTGPVNSYTSSDNGVTTKWLFLKKQTNKFVDLAVLINGTQQVGAVKSDLGAKADFGSCHVEVNDIKDLPAKAKGTFRLVTITVPNSKSRYAAEPGFLPSVSKQDLRTEGSYTINSNMALTESVDEKTGLLTIKIRLQSRQPIDKWPNIGLSKRLSLFGFFGHIAMQSNPIKR